MNVCSPDCPYPDQVHLAPEVDWIGDWPLTHGESERAVAGTGGFNGVYTESPDPYCLCGHPNYLTCPAAFGEGSVMGMEVEKP